MGILAWWLLPALSCITMRPTTAEDVSQYSVAWTDLLPEPGPASPGDPSDLRTYQNAMPIGNGHVAAMVNYESVNDSLTVLVSSSSSWGEDGSFLKVVIANVQLPSRGGAPIAAGGFKQVFNPQDATVRITIPPGGSAPQTTIVAYVDASSDSIVVSVSPPLQNPSLSNFTQVRPHFHTKTPNMDCKMYVVSADVLSTDGKLVYHRNGLNGGANFMQWTLLNENIPPVPGFADPLQNRTTGALLATFPVQQNEASTTFAITVLTAQTSTQEEFITAIQSASNAFIASQTDKILPSQAHLQWWAEKWNRHSIQIRTTLQSPQAVDDAFAVSRMYVLQRFIELSQARSPYPIKFNGMLYTAIRPPYSDNNRWGGLNWWQNLRHPYYNMLTAGDFDELRTLFLSFNRTVPVAQERTKAYFGFDGIWWPEYTHTLLGTEHPGCGIAECGYASLPNCTRAFPNAPTWHSDDRWNGYNRQGSLDLSLMILDHWLYSDEVNKDLLTIPMGVVEFYYNLWGNTSVASGQPMVFFPTQAIETWQCPGWPVNASDCPTNDMPTVAGLHAVIEKLIRLPSSIATAQQIQHWTDIQSRLPPLPVINGSLAPCADCIKGGTGPGSHRTSNGENADMYAVHPYRMATAARGDNESLTKAKAAFQHLLNHQDLGWNQVSMDAALLGNASTARDLVVDRVQSTALPIGYRFPAFGPNEQDYAPSADQFAIFANALQYMLVQQVDDADGSVVLLPAWPCDWNVNFTVAAPRNTTVSGSVVDGVLNYTVSPPSRANFVRSVPCQSVSPPAPPPPAHCNRTAWHEICPPNLKNVSECTSCCSNHQQQMFAIKCVGPGCWSDYCSGLYGKGCE